MVEEFGMPRRGASGRDHAAAVAPRETHGDAADRGMSEATRPLADSSERRGSPASPDPPAASLWTRIGSVFTRDERAALMAVAGLFILGVLAWCARRVVTAHSGGR